MKILTYIFTLIILQTLTACNSSSSEKTATENTLLSGTTTQLALSIMPNYLINDEELFVYDLTNNGALVLQKRVFPNEQGLTNIVLELEPNHIYKIVFNPNNNRTAIRCSLPKGCVERLFVNNDYASIAFGEPMNTRLQLTAIIDLTSDNSLTMNISTDIIAQLVQSNYVNEVNSDTLQQVQSVVANTLGFLGYEQQNDLANKNNWNHWNNQAFNAAILFDNRLLYTNVTDHLKSIFRRLYYTLVGDINLLGEFNQFYLTDADLFLQDVILSSSSSSNDEEQLLIARLRAYLLSKNIYPNKGYLPSPYVLATDVTKSKAFLNDFRSILYTFENDVTAVDQVNNALSDGYELIDSFSNAILVDLFPLFSDVLKTVPLGSDDGEYQLNDLTIHYQDKNLQWKLVGQYQDLTLDLTIDIEKIQLDSVNGNVLQIAALGKVASNEFNSQLAETKFFIKLNPADDAFEGSADGSGFIAINAQDITITQQQNRFSGAMTARIERHLVENNEIIETLESASIFGTLSDSTAEHKLSVSIVHPNVNIETSDKLIPNNMITAVTYAADIYGLGQPLLTVYMDLDNIAQGISLDNIDIAAYFEGRLAHFTFAGKTNDFTYQGNNQDGVYWSLTVKKKEVQGHVSLQEKQYGTPRVLKDLAGIMFNDGNFISIF